MTTSTIETARRVMTTAWTIRRNAATHFACRVSEIAFSPCLRMAWQQVRQPRTGMISHEFGGYNARRYSRPWGATLSIVNGRVEYRFDGQYMGDDCGGEVIIPNVTAGQIVAFGQRDNRRGSGTTNNWYMVNADLSLSRIERADAYRHMAS